jgi:hypothetical protein
VQPTAPDVVGHNLGKAVEELGLQPADCTIFDEPPGVARGVTAKLNDGREVRLWLARRDGLFRENRDWTFEQISDRPVEGVEFSKNPPATPSPLVIVYQNDFNGQVGTTFPEWTSSPITFHKTVTGEKGSLPAGAVATVESPNRSQRFLGEFGGPPIGRPGDPDWNRTRVDQTVSLSLKDLGRHKRVMVAFDLYILKSWDGNSKPYGPDRFMFRVGGGTTLLDTTFSNNSKVREDGSDQSYPGSSAAATSNPPQTGAVSTGTLGFSNFFKDSVYHLSFEFPHTEPTLKLEFASSLFEGKGTADESWGLDNVVVSADVRSGP